MNSTVLERKICQKKSWFLHSWHPMKVNKVFPKSPQMIAWGRGCQGEWCLLCLSYIWFKWASRVIIGKCEIKMLVLLWWNIGIIESVLVASFYSLRSERVMMWSLWILKRKVVSITLAQSVFCWLIIDRISSVNASGRMRFISSVTSELHEEGEQANFEVIGPLWLP